MLSTFKECDDWTRLQTQIVKQQDVSQSVAGKTIKCPWKKDFEDMSDFGYELYALDSISPGALLSQIVVWSFQSFIVLQEEIM